MDLFLPTAISTVPFAHVVSTAILLLFLQWFLLLFLTLFLLFLRLFSTDISIIVINTFDPTVISTDVLMLLSLLFQAAFFFFSAIVLIPEQLSHPTQDL
jgi:hypothetical protein